MTSAGGVDLTEAMVKAKSRTFDLESVFSLQMNGCNLRSLHACLNSCSGLWEVDLSSNQLSVSSLGVLDGRLLGKLRTLRLASNSLDSLAGFPSLPSLRALHVEGNGLRDLEWASHLRDACPRLQVLTLQRGSLSNPVCSKSDYRLDLLAALPRLRVLDGERLPTGGGGGGEDGSAFYAAYRQLEKETQQYADAAKNAASASKRASQELTTTNAQVARKLEDWFPEATWPAVLPADVDAELATRVGGVRTSLRECARLLAEEADLALAEFKSYDTNANGAGATAMTPRALSTAAGDADGNFGTFGAEAED